ncbi:MAG: biotin/lipoyl-binding protein [Myxococcaceae bacterium]|nr:biotin/lipoyl-binding protein [Myxococcaceae bacterium]MCA3016131.1 biotin/lipoyl-binding protein [Myxococcaceae bacterium]
MRPIERVLIANRGEVALRIMRTVRRMGLSSVAVFSDADESTPAVRFADVAVRLGGAAAKESYLRIDALLDAAKKTGADAVHPGFGFLSENPDFAQAVIDAGLVFVGPTPAAIRAMGLKREAKALVGRRGVPLVPGFDGGDQSTAELEAKALEVGLPVIFKPSAGGGGKGMKIARTPAELRACIESGRREAERAFGDPTLIIEKFLERPRHVEVQLLGDQHGTLLHLYERECSLQRRHQKVVEETPSPALTPALRERVCLAALEVGHAVSYTSAGTVEFIMEDGRFYFSEMNTRLQVEHRVTEQVTGLDLVEQQLRVARGERLAFGQDDVRPRGHAVQVRLYAEDPANQFLPCTGPVLDFWTPPLGALLVDAGIEAGGEVTPHYDPMVAKLVVHAETRDEALRQLARALDETSVLGLTTNKAFLSRLLRDPDVVQGELSTQTIAEKLSTTLAEPKAPARDALAAVAATLFCFEQRRERDDFLPGLITGFRNNRFRDQRDAWRLSDEVLTVHYRDLGGGRFLAGVGDARGPYRVVSRHGPALSLEGPEGVVHRLRVACSAEAVFVHTAFGDVTLRELPRFPPPGDEAVRGGFIAPMPGKVVKVLVRDGERVTRGQALIVLEAMKMEQTTSAPADGVVKAVQVREGDQVTAGQVLVVMED